MSESTENISMVSESGDNNGINTSVYNIATVDSLPQSMKDVNERIESMGIGSQLKFDSSEPSDVVDIVNCFNGLLDKICLQKIHLEEIRSSVRTFQKETERVNSEKQQLTRQIQQLKQTNQREISQLQKSLSDQQSHQRILEQQLKDVRTKANEAINKFNLQSVTLKQRENEIANLKSRLLNEMNKHPSKRLVYNMIGEECEDCVIDVNREFENKMCASYEKQLQNLRNRIFELEGIINKTNPIMNEMTTKNNEILKNFNTEPVRRVYPSSDQSIIYETPQYQFVSLFGNGEDIVTFTKSKCNQFEEQLKRISEANEKYSLIQLRNMLKEAQDIILEQLGLLYRFVDPQDPQDPQDQEDALSFLGENESDNHEVDNMNNMDNMDNIEN